MMVKLLFPGPTFERFGSMSGPMIVKLLFRRPKFVWFGSIRGPMMAKLFYFEEFAQNRGNYLNQGTHVTEANLVKHKPDLKISARRSRALILG